MLVQSEDNPISECSSHYHRPNQKDNIHAIKSIHGLSGTDGDIRPTV